MIGKDLITEGGHTIKVELKPIMKDLFEIKFKNKNLESINLLVYVIDLPKYISRDKSWKPLTLEIREVVSPNVSSLLQKYIIEGNESLDFDILLQDVTAFEIGKWQITVEEYEIDFGYLGIDYDDINYITIKIFPKTCKKIK